MSKNKNIPLLESIVRKNSFFRKLARKWKFRIEKKLLNNELYSNSNKKSIIHFSINKAATQYVKNILTRSAKDNDIIHVGIHEYAFYHDMPFLDKLSKKEVEEQYAYLFKEKGFLYSVFGGYIEGIQNIESYKIILVIRDPRDILVSMYFSKIFIHEVPIQESGKREVFLMSREEASKMTIDEYVLKEKEGVKAIFKRYDDLLISKYPNLYLTRYEDMLTDFPLWLKNILAYCELEIDSSLFSSFVTNQKKKNSKSEDIYKHDRKGVHGDFMEKLKPDTIKELNIYFSKYLKKFGYKVS
jgi:hypothetical protein